MNNLAPIVLFVYNRPQHTSQTIQALIKNELSKDSILIIFSDGPKKDATQEDLDNITEVRKIVNNITGFKKIIIHESNVNIGLDTSEINSVTTVLNKYGKIIVVEDDIVTHPSFLRFMNDCLNKYYKQDNIFMVTGFNHNIKVPRYYHKDVYIVHRGSPWGWGTWQNRWEKADWTMKGYEDIINNRRKVREFTRAGVDMLPLLINQMKEEIPAWDIRWDYCLYSNNAYCLRPIKSLVYNIGLDGTGAHNGIDDPVSKTAPFPSTDFFLYDLPFPVKFNRLLEFKLKSFIDGNPTILQRISYSVKKRISSIKK